jgi:hypothetical protein
VHSKFLIPHRDPAASATAKLACGAKRPESHESGPLLADLVALTGLRAAQGLKYRA